MLQAGRSVTEWAKREDAVRSVVLTGSRAIPGAALDHLSDYDICLFVTDVSRLADTDGWLETFGSILLMIREEATHLNRRVPTWLANRAVAAKPTPTSREAGRHVALDSGDRHRRTGARRRRRAGLRRLALA